ncbi:hypothetical protein KJ359_013291 [Pestalotiopsis sp. 9143b]|nr:hypothetical protein KJ359_013291 [Pestalotiopsis sp. 9143b]
MASAQDVEDVKSNKRNHAEFSEQNDSDSSTDDDMGPQLPSVAAPKKKRRVLPYEKLYISALPKAQRYSKSLMHKEQLAFVTVTPLTEFIITSSTDGVVKFWKKVASGIEFVKEFKAHVGEIRSVSVSQDGRSFATNARAKSTPVSLSMSPSGHQFVTYSFPDRKIRVFEFASAKLYRTYDESLQVVEEMQQAGTAKQKLEPVEFGRRRAAELEIESPALRNKVNVIFDESGNFILYGSILGVKVLNTFTNHIVKVYGKDENMRPVNLALYQGQPSKKGLTTVAMAASANPLLQEAESRDPILITTAVGKVRFYMFTDDAEASKSERDVQNEKPTMLGAKKTEQKKQAETGTSAIVHTSYGDIHIRLFPDAAPKAVENFVTHSKRGYYNNTIFHRVIRKFMIQCGDPLGDGTGGESIWGREFEDEFSTLKHDKPYTVSMANAGPNTNGSQFFITTEKTPWLDNKHTIFGRAIQGLDVIHKIENVRTYKEKPEEDIKILNIDIA